MKRLTLICLSSLTPLCTGCHTMEKASPLAMVEKSLVYHPKKLSAEYEPPFAGFENAVFTSEDGTKLNGWFVEHPEPKAVALFFHGNGGNIASVAESLNVLHQEHRLSAMTFDYRGYGRSEGKPNEEGILADARAAKRWLAERTQVQESDILLLGHSMGGGVAVDLAAKDGARGLVLSNTFTSLPDVGNHHFPWVPTRMLMTQRLDSISKISSYHGPLLQSHGDADSVVPFELGQQLFAAANEPKTFVLQPGGGHNDPKDATYRVALNAFIDQLPR